MLNRNKTGLQIFDEFTIDRKLPKHFKPEVEGKSVRMGGTGTIDGSLRAAMDANEMSNPAWGTPNDMPVMSFNRSFANLALGGRNDSDDEPTRDDSRLEVGRKVSKRFWSGILLYLFGWMLPKPKEAEPKIGVLEFFKLVKSNLESPDAYVEKVNEYMKVAQHAHQMGQTALYEEITSEINMIKTEALLLGSNFKTRITEEQIVQFYKESDKGLSLHYVKNFGRMVPNEVLQLKTKADQLMIFDNYVILHYDKDKKSFKETEAEKEKRKDPILFGVIAGVRKLYYIADWIDEHCDLTLKDLIDKFGEDAIKANDITVNYKK